MDSLRPFLFREAISLWLAGFGVADISRAMSIDTGTIVRWIAKRGRFRPFTGRLNLGDGPAARELRRLIPDYLRALEQAMRMTAIETLEAEIDGARFDIADLVGAGRTEEADQLREYMLAASKRLDSLYTIDAHAQTEESPDA